MSGVSSQETTSGRPRKAPIRARLITYAKNSGDIAEIRPHTHLRRARSAGQGWLTSANACHRDPAHADVSAENRVTLSDQHLYPG